jgi:hypothetical protein
VTAVALAAVGAAQVVDAAGVLLGLGRQDRGGVVGAGVVDHVDPQPVAGVVERHELVDGGAEHGGLVPRRHQHGRPRQVLGGAAVVVVGGVQGDEQVLVDGHEQRQRPEQGGRHQRPEGDVADHAGAGAAGGDVSAPTTPAT